MLPLHPPKRPPSKKKKLALSSLLPDINKILGTLNARSHLLPLVQTATVSGTIKFSAAVSNEPFNLQSILQTIHNNPITVYGDVQVTNLASQSWGYKREKIQMENAFFAALSSSPDAKPLADMIVDPEYPQRSLRQLYVLCRGTATPAKKALLNWALLLFSTSFHIKKKGKLHLDLIKDPQTFVNAQYKPNTVENKFKILFSTFKYHSIHYSFAKDFNNQGVFLFCHQFNN